MRIVTFLDFSNPLPHRNGGGTTLHIGALYIVSALERNQYVVDYRDYQTSKYCNSLKLSDMLEFAANSANTVMLSCMAYMLPLAVLLVQKLKLANPQKVIIMGGPGPAGVAEDLVTTFPYIDYVVKGEGEVTVPLLLDCIESNIGTPASIPGLVFYREKLYSNPPKRIVNLDDVPFPAYHKVNMNDYSMFGIITGRGCVYRCKFCDVHGLWGDQYQRRSISNVLDEIELLVKKYGVTRLDIWDDTFIVDRTRVVEFVNGLTQRELKVNWSCFGRINLIDEELLQLMSGAGCDAIFYGIESGSQSVLDKIDKHIDLAEVNKVIDMSLKYVKVSAHLIWGFPFETIEDLYRTIFLYNYLCGKIRIGLGQLWPYPTAPLFDEYKTLLCENDDPLEFHKILPLGKEHELEERQIHELVHQYPHIFTQYTVFMDYQYPEKRNVMRRLLLLSDG